MKKILILTAICAAAGVLTAEYRPDLFSSGFDSLGASFSSPFGSYRNRLALKYGTISAFAGFAAGMIVLAAKKLRTGAVK